MAAPYSIDLRERVLRRYEQGELSQEEVAKRFLVSVKTVNRWWRGYQKEGRIAPKPMGGWLKPKVDEAGGLQIQAWLEKTPDLTLAELCEHYESAFGVSMSTSAMDRGLKRLKITRKKNTL
jgi:putative transposase